MQESDGVDGGGAFLVEFEGLGKDVGDGGHYGAFEGDAEEF